MKRQMFLLILVLVFTNCSDEDDALQPTCFQDENRKVVETLKHVEGLVIAPNAEECSEIFTLVLKNDTENRYLLPFWPCNLPVDFQTDSLEVVYSGYLFETFETEDICAFPFEITTIEVLE